MQDLGTFFSGSGSSSAIGVNGDGSVVVGYASMPGVIPLFHAFRWTPGGGMQDLGTIGTGSSMANAVSADGAIVVGDASTPNGRGIAFRWTAATGMADLNALLSSAGVNMTGIVLTSARAISSNGQFIVGYSDFPGEPSRAFIVRYLDQDATPTPSPSPIAGVTTFASVQDSIEDLSNARAGVMGQQHGLVAPLLGGDKPMGLGNEVGAFASAGSASAGGSLRYSLGNGISVLGGIAFAKESYPDADLRYSGIGALALRYTYIRWDWWRPFVEGGGWYAPNTALSFSRSYLNGAGTATGIGRTHADLTYYYARTGLLLAKNKWDQLTLSAEYGRERMAVDAYAEPVSSSNPFEAHVAAGTDATDLAKVRFAWSRRLTPSLDATLWAAGVRAFDRESELVAFVPGIGILKPGSLPALSWAEYGGRIGYKLNNTVTVDAFINGVSGEAGFETRIHAGTGVRVQF
jgi:probable HAF family extracellular repeat protein